MTSADFSEVSYFRHRAHTMCMGLFLRLEEYVEDFPTGTPERLINLLRQIVEGVQSSIERQDDIRELTQTCYVLATLGQSLNYLDNAHTAEAPQGLVQMLESLQAYNDGCLLVAPQVEYNYSIFNLLPALEKLTEGFSDTNKKYWQDIFEPFRGGISVVSFPRIERENILIHAIFGHEFGHPIAAKFLAEYEAHADYNKQVDVLREEIKQRFKEELERFENKNERVARETELFEEVRAMHRRALAELTSDAVGAFLFGPSALFAAVDVLVPFGLDNPPNYPALYPPSRYRLRHIWHVMEKEIASLRAVPYTNDIQDVGKAVSVFLAYVESLTKAEDDRRMLEEYDIVDIAYKWVERTIPEAVAKAQSLCGNQCFNPESLQKEIPEAVQRLNLEIPPSEIGLFPEMSPVNWRSAMLAGWLYKIYLTTAGASDLPKQLRSTQRLTLKGIEDCLLLKAYADWTAARTRR